MKRLAKNIRQTAQAAGLGVEQFRRAHGLPNTYFYAALRGELPARVDTRLHLFERLRRAGVVVPDELKRLTA